MYSAGRRLLFEVRLIYRTNGLFDKAPARFFGDFINFSDPFFFSSLFSRLLRYKLNSFLVVMALHCIIMTSLEETEYIALRDFAKSLRELKNIFFQKSVFTLLSLVNYLVYLVF